jgi:hypothetical protein
MSAVLKNVSEAWSDMVLAAVFLTAIALVMSQVWGRILAG